ncbi:WalW protein [Catenovulum agarivorans DS-2]|uniref:WalW protein n=1 Tax=Catenovulum agarivorans DS-2 TaxID=1328313 RepID=W7QE17_9ALTE|nr:polysaccharide deacetylase family protein [Catenovulum agarivorans]EWH11139.1 WalW protein [Catenovulum agarivorans DS-2]
MAPLHKPKVKFVISVDTEEEWDWSGPFPQKDFSVDNVQQIPAFQNFCQGLGIKPSYFVDYAVANDPNSVDLLNSAVAGGKGEIAAHLHPWCNPPYYAQTTEFESHVINLPIGQVEAKLKQLTDKLKTVFNTHPRAFRTGRWGISGDVLKLLVKFGYDIDSSVYPYYRHKFFTCQGAPIYPYFPDFDNVVNTGEQRDILQIPVSVGFNHANFALSNKIHNWIETPALQWLRPVGVAWHSRLLRKHYLCPELSTAKDMICLVKSMLKRNEKVFHMYLHSSSLLTSSTGFMRDGEGAHTIVERIQPVFEYLQQNADVECMTISQVADWFKQEQA